MFIKLMMLAFSLEGMAVLMVSRGDTGFYAMLAVYLVHAVASAVIAVAVWLLYPAPMRSPRWPVLGLLFFSNFFVPLLLQSQTEIDLWPSRSIQSSATSSLPQRR